MSRIRTWIDNPKAGLEDAAFFGDLSEVAACTTSQQQIRQDLKKLAEDKDVWHRFEGDVGGGVNAEELCFRVEGLIHLLDGFAAWQSNQDPHGDSLNSFVEAIKSFDKAWPQTLLASRERWTLVEKDVSAKLSQLKEEIRKQSGGTRGCDIVCDSLERLLPNPQSIPNTVTTPVLLVERTAEQEKNGYIAWLTIQLICDGGVGFAPDAFKPGLTSICFPDADGDTFLKIMDRMWHLSQVESKGFRGRWSLETRCPEGPGAVKPHEDQWEQFCPRNLIGRSVECSVLAALMAASGKISYEEYEHFDTEAEKIKFVSGNPKKPFAIDRHNPLKLLNRVAATATVTVDENPELPVQAQLGFIDDLDIKLGAAGHYKLMDNATNTLIDQVLLSEEQFTHPTDEMQSLLNASDQASRDKVVYEDITLVKCATVSDALDWMLEVNAWKKAWNQKNADDWESLWGYARNEDRHLVDINNEPIPDDDGHPTEDLEKVATEQEHRLINTGSIEFMKLGGKLGANELTAEREPDAASDEV